MRRPRQPVRTWAVDPVSLDVGDWDAELTPSERLDALDWRLIEAKQAFIERRLRVIDEHLARIQAMADELRAELAMIRLAILTTPRS